MSDEEQDFTPWKIVAVALGTLVTAVSAMWAMIQVHADNPHKGAITRNEFEMDARHLKSRMDRIEQRLHILESRE